MLAGLEDKRVLIDMDPITLRLSTEMLNNLDEEADEAGFSSRSEYIRYLLAHRDALTIHPESDIDPNTFDTAHVVDLYQSHEELYDRIEVIEDRLGELEAELGAVQSQVDAAREPEPSRSSARDLGKEASDSAGKATNVTGTTGVSKDDNTTEDGTEGVTADLEEFNQWLTEEGPQSEDAQSVLREAAHILADNGPMNAKELRRELVEQYPDAYNSEETLWAATVLRFYEEAPGLVNPKRGVYDFEG